MRRRDEMATDEPLGEPTIALKREKRKWFVIGCSAGIALCFVSQLVLGILFTRYGEYLLMWFGLMN
jgi:hypothetical protein